MSRRGHATVDRSSGAGDRRGGARAVLDPSAPFSPIAMVVRIGALCGLFIAMFAGLSAVMPLNVDRYAPAAAADVEEVQGAIAPSERVSVAVYGDSRARFMGAGLSLVPGWSPIYNQGRESCSFLAQSDIWRSFGPTHGPEQRNVSKQRSGEIVTCDTRTYLADQPMADVALLYAGTLFTVDLGTGDGVLHSPVEPDWADYLVGNLVESLSAIRAERVVVLGTPVSTAGQATEGDRYWDEPARIAAVNEILRRAAELAGVEYLAGFAAWVDAQPESCQPDGAHMTVSCAASAGSWIKEQLAALDAGANGDGSVPSAGGTSGGRLIARLVQTAAASAA